MNIMLRKYISNWPLVVVAVLLMMCFVWAIQQAVIRDIEVDGVGLLEQQESIRLALYQRYYGSHMSVSEQEMSAVISQISPEIGSFVIDKDWFANTVRINIQQAFAAMPLAYTIDVCDSYKTAQNYSTALIDILIPYQLALKQYAVDCIGTISAQTDKMTIQLGYVTDDLVVNLTLLQHVLHRFQKKLIDIQEIDMRYDHGVAIRWTHTQSAPILDQFWQEGM